MMTHDDEVGTSWKRGRILRAIGEILGINCVVKDVIHSLAVTIHPGQRVQSFGNTPNKLNLIFRFELAVSPGRGLQVGNIYDKFRER